MIWGNWCSVFPTNRDLNRFHRFTFTRFWCGVFAWNPLDDIDMQPRRLQLRGRLRCLFLEGQAFCVEELLARWDRGVNCRYIIPLLSLSLSLPPLTFSFFPLFFHHLSFLALSFTLMFPFIHILTFLSSSLTIYCPYSKLPFPRSTSIPASHTHEHTPTHTHWVSFGVWNQRSNRWHHLWFMAHSERALIRCRHGSACAWMTIEDQSHYASQPRSLHSGHCRLHLASWFMGAILAPERDTEGRCGGEGVEAVVSRASVDTPACYIVHLNLS